MLNGTVGVQRLLARLRPDTERLAPAIRRRTSRATRGLRTLRAPTAVGSIARTTSDALRPAISPERAVPVAVAGIVAAAALLAYLPGGSGATGGPGSDGPAPRIVVGGVAGAGWNDDEAFTLEEEPADEAGRMLVDGPNPVDGSFTPVELPDTEAATTALSGPFLDDGTLVAGVAPDTTIPDGSALMRSYRVQAGDTLTGIASKFKVSMMTVWWANNLRAKDDLKVGQVLRIPPVSGLVVSVGDSDTIESLAARHKVTAQEIVEANGLDQPTLVVGQTLIIPGALGASIATPTPKPTPKPTARTSTRSGSSGGGSVRAPSSYSGGSFVWPVVGGDNYISQYFRYGHYGLDIAADRGSTVRAAARGTVIFAGWKSNGGGYQVWIAHGSGLYTTYNHMSGVSVGRGQTVGRGQQVGRIGCTGYCSGPHLHFEVWKGMIWDGGTRVNPLRYY